MTQVHVQLSSFLKSAHRDLALLISGVFVLGGGFVSKALALLTLSNSAQGQACGPGFDHLWLGLCPGMALPKAFFKPLEFGFNPLD